MPLMFLGDWNINLVAAEKVPAHLGEPNELKLLGEFAAKGLVLCEEGFPDTGKVKSEGPVSITCPATSILRLLPPIQSPCSNTVTLCPA